MSPKELYQQANLLFEKRKTEDGIRMLERAAEEGYADAQFQMASIIREHGIRPIEHMIKWLNRAANQNHIYAINNLAICYQQGIGVTRDIRKGFILLNKAVALGDAMAEFNVGQAYFFGLGVPQDIEKGEKLVLRAAYNGCANAQHMMGELNEKKNVEEAILWYKRAAFQNNELSISALESLGSNGHNINAPDPIIINTERSGLLVRADILDPQKYSSTNANYANADVVVGLLYERVKQNNDKIALDVLSELCGNYMNKNAFNALVKLGKMASMIDESSRRGCAEYLCQAWKSFDREKLEILVFWSFPSFEYKEFDTNKKLIYSTSIEKEFVDHLMLEMISARENGSKIMMRIREENGNYLTDVMVGNVVSTFSFQFGEKAFIGVVRHFQ